MAFTFKFIVQAWDQIQLRVCLEVAFSPLLHKRLHLLHYFLLWMMNELSQVTLKVPGRNLQMKGLSTVTCTSVQQLNEKRTIVDSTKLHIGGWGSLREGGSTNCYGLHNNMWVLGVQSLDNRT